MAQARNDAQLKAMLLPKIKIAVDYVVQKIWEENKKIIQEVVYDVYGPVRYNRTGEFKEAWAYNAETKNFKSKVEGKFQYAPDKLTPGDDDPNSPRYGQHVSAIDRMLMTEYLAEVIYQGKSGPAFGHGTTSGQWHKKRDAWAKLESALGARKLKQWMEEGFNKAALKVRSHGTSWGKTSW